MIEQGGTSQPADWPSPNTRPCGACGHVWFPGERRHEYLDLTAERHEDAEVLCVLCRRKRGLPRADAHRGGRDADRWGADRDWSSPL